jgi:outer membrane protein OmpA-like peptidoglycan-associated protein
MRNILLASLLTAAAALPSAALAQEKTKSVDDYLCTFAGKCGGEEAAGEVTKDAPETKGFSLSRPGAAKMAPATRGFSLTKPGAISKTVPSEPVKAASAPARTQAPAKAAPARQMASKSAVKKPMAMASVSKTIRQTADAAKRGDLSLNFELGSAVLTPVARENARAFAQALLRPELASKRIMIEGHTDAQGSREFNVELSKARAQAVADYLAEQGVSSDRLEVNGYGFDRPLPGRSASSSDNRRVEAVLGS